MHGPGKVSDPNIPQPLTTKPYRPEEKRLLGDAQNNVPPRSEPKSSEGYWLLLFPRVSYRIVHFFP